MTSRLSTLDDQRGRVGIVVLAAALVLYVPVPSFAEPLVTEVAHLFASDAAAVDEFGSSVAVAGDTLLVGAFIDDTTAGINAGSAYVFVRDGNSWTEQAHMFASDGSDADQFGLAVALDGNTAVVGAYADDTAAGVDVGSVYVFVRTGTTWTEQAHLFPSQARPGGSFGHAVAIAGDTVLVGATPLSPQNAGANPGSAYVFVRTGTTWTEQAHFFAADGEPGDQFGHSVAVWGDTAVIGAYADDNPSGIDAGSAFIFTRSGTTWSEQAHLLASDGQTFDSFGSSVALTEDTALIGSFADDTPVGLNTGSAYVFVRNAITWSEQAQLFPSELTGLFGVSVDLAGDLALIGAVGTGTEAGPNVGSAFLFTRSGTSWMQEAHLFASDGDRNDLFGGSVALTGDTGIVGAAVDDTAAGPDAGSAYIYAISSASSCTITGTEGDDRLPGTDGDDVICGLGGDDRLAGGDGNDTLLGGDGNDTLDGGAGMNALDGGEGNDTATYFRAPSGVRASLVTGTATGPSSDSFASIENLIGSNSDDRLAGDDGDNTLNGKAGNDRLNGGPGTDTCINGESVIACEP
jgi:Ca2+-binding RTX toxin-like protein